MSKKTYKTIETPSGSGEIRKAGAHLAKVFYHLQVRQETIVGELAAGQEDRPGRLGIGGGGTVSAGWAGQGGESSRQPGGADASSGIERDELWRLAHPVFGRWPAIGRLRHKR